MPLRSGVAWLRLANSKSLDFLKKPIRFSGQQWANLGLTAFALVILLGFFVLCLPESNFLFFLFLIVVASLAGSFSRCSDRRRGHARGDCLAEFLLRSGRGRHRICNQQQCIDYCGVACRRFGGRC